MTMLLEKGKGKAAASGAGAKGKSAAGGGGGAGGPKPKQVMSRGLEASVAPGGQGFECPRGSGAFFDTVDKAIKHSATSLSLSLTISSRVSQGSSWITTCLRIRSASRMARHDCQDLPCRLWHGVQHLGGPALETEGFQDGTRVRAVLQCAPRFPLLPPPHNHWLSFRKRRLALGDNLPLTLAISALPASMR
jgi:hypothetical protein